MLMNCSALDVSRVRIFSNCAGIMPRAMQTPVSEPRRLSARSLFDSPDPSFCTETTALRPARNLAFFALASSTFFTLMSCLQSARAARCLRFAPAPAPAPAPAAAAGRFLFWRSVQWFVSVEMVVALSASLQKTQ